ncbi:MAG: FAD-dependent oxidoreductase, partial [Alphaproteobacteria bacterium]
MTEQCDVLIIGAGVAGLSTAWRLAEHRRVVIVERESQPGYHTSGRSAAQFAQTFEPPAMRRLAVASRDFFERPPHGFADHPIATPRSSLVLARPGQEDALEAEIEACAALGIGARLVGEAETRRLFPPLLPGLFSAGLDEPEAKYLDVDLILRGYLKGMRAGGGRLAVDAEVTGLERRGGLWHAATRAG